MSTCSTMQNLHHGSVMSKRRKILMASGILAVGLIWALLAEREREPSYQGRTLSQWYVRWAKSIEREDNQSEVQCSEAVDAIRQIGTTALPTLLKELKRQASSSPAREVIYGLVNRLPSSVSKAPVVASMLLNADKLEPSSIFVILGPQAAPAIPELTGFLNATNNLELVQSAAFCLAAIGDEGLPPLLGALAKHKQPSCYAAAYWLGVVASPFHFGTNLSQAVPLLVQCTTAADQRLAETAIKAIGHIHQEPQISVPALATCLASTNSMIRRTTLRSLARFGKASVPLLMTALKDSDEFVRRTATNMVMLIAPDTFTSAPAD